MKQRGHTKDMIFDVPYILQYVSKYMNLGKGDLILTGTPGGVGPLVAGDQVSIGMSFDDENIAPSEGTFRVK